MRTGLNTPLTKILAMTPFKYSTTKAILNNSLLWKTVIPMSLEILKKSMPRLRIEDTSNIRTFVILSLTCKRRSHTISLHFTNTDKPSNIIMIIKTTRLKGERRHKIWQKKSNYGTLLIPWLMLTVCLPEKEEAIMEIFSLQLYFTKINLKSQMLKPLTHNWYIWTRVLTQECFIIKALKPQPLPLCALNLKKRK